MRSILNAEHHNLGKTVVIQVIPRSKEDKELLDLDHMVKFVGKFEAFVISQSIFTFKLEGLPYQDVYLETEDVEIYLGGRKRL